MLHLCFHQFLEFMKMVRCQKELALDRDSEADMLDAFVYAVFRFFVHVGDARRHAMLDRCVNTARCRVGLDFVQTTKVDRRDDIQPGPREKVGLLRQVLISVQ